MCQHHFLNVLFCSSEAALAGACSVRLPKNGETGHGVVLGEGKPENQNAAIIFCFGEVVQVRCCGCRLWGVLQLVCSLVQPRVHKRAWAIFGWWRGVCPPLL